MVIITKTANTAFGRDPADAADALNNGPEIALKADGRTLADINHAFNSVDYVGNERFAFNIKESKYRIVAMIFFDIRTMALLEITPTRLSEIINGKRKVNMDLAKRLYQKLNADPKFILENA